VYLLLDILPFVAFILVKRWKSIKEGVIVSIVLAIPAVGFHIFVEQSTGPVLGLVIVSLGLLVLMGWLSYKQDNDILFKFQPVIVGGVLGLILLVAFYGFDYAVMKELVNEVSNQLPLEIQAQFNTPQMQQAMYHFSRNMGYGFLILSGLIAFAALKLGDWWWLIFRVAGIYVVGIIAYLYAL